MDTRAHVSKLCVNTLPPALPVWAPETIGRAQVVRVHVYGCRRVLVFPSVCLWPSLQPLSQAPGAAATRGSNPTPQDGWYRRCPPASLQQGAPALRREETPPLGSAAGVEGALAAVLSRSETLRASSPVACSERETEAPEGRRRLPDLLNSSPKSQRTTPPSRFSVRNRGPPWAIGWESCPLHCSSWLQGRGWPRPLSPLRHLH